MPSLRWIPCRPTCLMYHPQGCYDHSRSACRSCGAPSWLQCWQRWLCLRSSHGQACGQPRRHLRRSWILCLCDERLQAHLSNVSA